MKKEKLYKGTLFTWKLSRYPHDSNENIVTRHISIIEVKLSCRTIHIPNNKHHSLLCVN